MNKQLRLKMFLLATLFLLFQIYAQAQQETLPDNGVQFINKTKDSIAFNLDSAKTDQWDPTGYVLLSGKDRVMTDVRRIAICDGSSPRVIRKLVYKTRYVFWWNPEINFWDIKPKPE